MATPTGALFYEPLDKPLSAAGQVMAGAYRLFYLTGTTTPTNVYADGALTTPLSQVPGQAQPSCTADGNGRFNAIYLDPNIIYRVQLFSQGGILLQDVDPYVPAQPGSSYQTGTFTIGSTGFVSNPSATATYVIFFNRIVHLFIPPIGPSTSNATTFTLTGLPPAIVSQFGGSGTLQEQEAGVFDNGAEASGQFLLAFNSNVIQMEKNANLGGWTASGLKGVGNQIVTYYLN